MTSQRSSHEIDGELAPVENAQSRSTLDAATLQQWQSELDEFVVQIRGRLQSLSDSLTQWKSSQQPTVTQSRAAAEPSALHPTTELETLGTDFPESQWVAQGPPETSPDPEPGSDADPLERLKRRLAQQIESV